MSEAEQISAEEKSVAQPKEGPPNKPRKQALVLSGGGIRGAYQAGAIAEILKPEYGFKPSAIYGISIGSINGGMLATYVGQQFLENPDLKEPGFQQAGERLKEYWDNNITDHTKIVKERNRFVIVLEVIFKNFHGLLNVDKSIEIIRSEIHRNDLRRAAEKGKLKFYAGTLNLTTGKYYNIPHDDCDIIEYIIASAMGPLVMPMHVIPPLERKPFPWQWKVDFKEYRRRNKPDQQDRDECWLDGGIHNVAPVSAAIEDEYDDIVCILCRPDTIARGSFQGRLGKTAERISDVVAQNILDDDIQWALDMREWIQSLKTCVDRLPPDTGKKTKFSKYRKFDLWVVRPKAELPYKEENVEKGQVRKMVSKGVEDAREVMLYREQQLAAASLVAPVLVRSAAGGATPGAASVPIRSEVGGI